MNSPIFKTNESCNFTTKISFVVQKFFIKKVDKKN